MFRMRKDRQIEIVAFALWVVMLFPIFITLSQIGFYHTGLTTTVPSVYRSPVLAGLSIVYTAFIVIYLARVISLMKETSSMTDTSRYGEEHECHDLRDEFFTEN